MKGAQWEVAQGVQYIRGRVFNDRADISYTLMGPTKVAFAWCSMVSAKAWLGQGQPCSRGKL